MSNRQFMIKILSVVEKPLRNPAWLSEIFLLSSAKVDKRLFMIDMNYLPRQLKRVIGR